MKEKCLNLWWFLKSGYWKFKMWWMYDVRWRSTKKKLEKKLAEGAVDTLFGYMDMYRELEANKILKVEKMEDSEKGVNDG